MNVWELVRAGLPFVVPSFRWTFFFILAFSLGFIYAISNYPRITSLIATVQLSFEQLRSKSASGNWYPARFERPGLLRYDAARTHAGYTLYALAADLSAHLIDMTGREVHGWSLSRERIMPEAARQARTLFGTLEPQLECGHLFQNGDLLLVYEQKAMGAWDTLLVKLDKDSHLLWKTTVNAHHAVEVVEDKIYALTGTFKAPSPTSVGSSLADRPYIDESVSILDFEGKELSSHSILRAFANTKHMRLADELPVDDRIDLLHSNSLDVLNEQTARFFVGAKRGNVLLSLRNLDLLVIMDLESETIVWALRGGWRGQHDAKVLPNGHILLFDNQGGLLKHGRSRVLEIAPSTGGIVWSFDGTVDDPLESDIRGGAQRMTGGNTIISESAAGRILEVTPDGSVVWEYVNPLHQAEGGREIVAALGLTVIRYESSYVSFLSERGDEAAR